MLITLDELKSYLPTTIKGKPFWKKGGDLFIAHITELGMVLLSKVACDLKRARAN